MGLQETVDGVRQGAETLGGTKAANEANTKALLIEPMLNALGWNTTNLEAVEREVKVYEGTYLDYALKVDNAPRLYVEAKAIGEKLDDKKFVAQTLNYANNDGVVWCVLTSGIRYRIYKTNEPVSMDQKLLAEVDLSDDDEPDAEKLRLLRLIGRTAVEAGQLDDFGDRVFTDTRVRKALADLAKKSAAPLRELVAKELGHPPVEAATLKASLIRVLDADSDVTPTPAGKSTPSAGPSVPPKGKQFSLDRHLGGKSALIRELFEGIDQWAPTLGSDVSRRIRKFYVGFFRGKRSFCTLEVQQRRVIVYLSLQPQDAKPWNEAAMRDVRNIGHYGMGDTEYSLRETSQLTEIKTLIEKAYASHK